MFENKRIELFCALYEEKSVSKAAGVASMSQPSASRILKEMRTELDDELFILVRNQLQPTDYATRLYPHMREVLDKISQASEVRKNIESVYQLLHVNVAAVDYFLTLVCPRLIDSVSEYIDDVFIRMTPATYGVTSSSNLANDLRLGRLDFVAHEDQDLGQNLTKKTILSDKWCIIKPEDCELDELPYIQNGRSAVDKKFEGEETCGLVPDFKTLVELVKESVGYAVVPSRLVNDIKEITIVPVELPAYKLYLYWRPDRSKDQRLHLFRKVIVKECASLPAGAS